jgi:predicted transcriptional regulator
LRVLELTVQGWTQHAIAADLGISQAAVSKILKRADARLLRELSTTVERYKVRHSLRLERLFAEALASWERSKADRSRRRQRKTQGESGAAGSTVAEIVVENQHGDPRYLAEARKALADYRKVWGLDAPQRVDLRPVHNPYADLSDEELHAALERQAQLLDRPPGVVAVSSLAPPATEAQTNESLSTASLPTRTEDPTHDKP